MRNKLKNPRYILSCYTNTKEGWNCACIYECIDGLFPAPDLGKFGLKYWCFKELFYYLIYATLEEDDKEDQAYLYWATDQMVKQFNDHYKNKFYNGWKVTADEGIF